MSAKNPLNNLLQDEKRKMFKKIDKLDNNSWYSVDFDNTKT